VTALGVFDYVCQEIERSTKLTGAVARGTVRLALKEAGLDPDSVDVAQMRVVVDELLPAELASHRIDGVEALCERLRDGLSRHQFSGATDRAGAASSVLARLGG
jgi:hypothetical protein